MNLRKRGIYLLPNLFTTGALFAGFYAIVQAMNGHFEHSAVAIFIAMVLDGLDGRVARLTHTRQIGAVSPQLRPDGCTGRGIRFCLRHTSHHPRCRHAE